MCSTVSPCLKTYAPLTISGDAVRLKARNVKNIATKRRKSIWKLRSTSAVSHETDLRPYPTFQQRDSKRENAEMQQNCLRSYFIHRQSEKAGDESVDPCNAAERCHYGDDFSHDVFFYTLRLRSAVVSPGMIGSFWTGPAACSPPKRGSLNRGSSRQSLCSHQQGCSRISSFRLRSHIRAERLNGSGRLCI